VFRAAAAIADDLSTTEFSSLVTEANRSATSEAQMLEVFRGVTDRVLTERSATAGMAPRRSTAAQRLARVANIRSILPTLDEARAMPPAMQASARKNLVQLIKAVEAVVEVLEA
jgi:hypothetical protein